MCFTLMDSAKSMATSLGLSWLMCCRRSHQMETCPLWMSFALMKLWTCPSIIQFKVSSRHEHGFGTFLHHSLHSGPEFLDLTFRTIHARYIEVLCIVTQWYNILHFRKFLQTYWCDVCWICMPVHASFIHPHSSFMFLPQWIKHKYYVPPHFD